MKSLLSFIIVFCTASVLRAETPKAPPPPELQALAETLVSAIKAQNDEAFAACWHSPEILAKRKEAEALAASGTSPTEINVPKEREKELKKREKDMTVSKRRIGEVRTLITKYFGDLAALKLVELEVDPDDEALEPGSEFNEVELHLVAADGARLKLELDDALRIDGVWKFKGRVEGKLSIELSEP